MSDQGKASAVIVYVLYLLSIPSAAILALVGVMVALIGREHAVGVWRAHLNNQLHIWSVAFLWGIALFAAGLISYLLTVVLIGFVMLWVCGLAAFAVMVWFTIKSAMGMLALMSNRAP